MRKRNIFIPICIFLVFLGIVLFCLTLSKVTEYKVFAFNKKNFYLYQESNKQWFKISKNEFVKKYGDKNHRLYVDHIYKGKFNYSIVNNEIEMVNPMTNIVTRYTKDNYFTYTGSSKIEYISIEGGFINKEDERTIFNKLKEYKLEKDYNVSYMRKYALNIDNDANNEYIYIISNMVDYENTIVNDNLDKMFTFMFLKDGKNIYDIYSSTSKSNMCIPTVEAVLKFKRDNSYKLISYCDNVSKNSSKLNLYNYKNEKFSLINVNS